jgi:small subunit ribosomal protein S1
VHLSELSWDRISHPKEILEVGQEVKVKVINIDSERKRIGLSLRALSDDPWRSRIEKFSVGQLVEGVITRLTKFGAFARLESDIEGLIHISEISENRIEHPKEVLKEGEVVALRIIRIDPEQHRIGLSLRKVDSAAFADKDFKLLAQEIDQLEEEPTAVMDEEEPVAEETTEEEANAESEAVAAEEESSTEPKAEKPVEEEASAVEPEADVAEEEESSAEPEAEKPAEEEASAEEPEAEESAEDETEGEPSDEPSEKPEE